MKTSQVMEPGHMRREATGGPGRRVALDEGITSSIGQGTRFRVVMALLIVIGVLVAAFMVKTGDQGVTNVARGSTTTGTEQRVEPWFPPQAHAYLPRAGASVETELTAADFPPQAQAYLPRGMSGLRAELTAADFPPQAHAYLPRTMRGLSANVAP